MGPICGHAGALEGSTRLEFMGHAKRIAYGLPIDAIAQCRCHSMPSFQGPDPDGQRPAVPSYPECCGLHTGLSSHPPPGDGTRHLRLPSGP